MASSEQTTKRHLNKPQPEDFVNVINDICDNMDNLDDAVPDSRKVNGHALNGDITVSKSDVGLGNVDNVQQVPATRKVNNKPLSSDINLQGTDIQVSSSDSRKVDAAIANCDSETASLKSAFLAFNLYTYENLIPVNPISTSHRTVKFEHIANNIFHVYGTNNSSTGAARANIYNNSNSLPEGIVAGNKYHAVKYMGNNITFRIYWIDSSGTEFETSNLVDKDTFTVPDDAVGARIAFYVSASLTVDDFIGVGIYADIPAMVGETEDKITDAIASTDIIQHNVSRSVDIPDNTDLFTLTPGSYITATTVVSELTNCPTTNTFRMEIINRVNGNTWIAILIDSQDNLFIANKPVSGIWHDWVHVARDGMYNRIYSNLHDYISQETRTISVIDPATGETVETQVTSRWIDTLEKAGIYRITNSDDFFDNPDGTDNMTALLICVPIEERWYCYYICVNGIYFSLKSTLGVWSKWVLISGGSSSDDENAGLPDYYDEYLPEKIAGINALEDDISINSDSFIFLTDYHITRNAQHSMELIKSIINGTGLTKFVFGGDAYATNVESKATNQKYVTSVYSAFQKCAPNFFCLLGNHEWNKLTSADTEYVTESYENTIAGVYNFCIKRTEFEVSGMTEEGNYYLDNKAKGIRYFFLQENGLAKITDDTLSWFANELMSIPSGYYVVVFMHYAYITGGTGTDSIQKRINTSVKRISTLFGAFDRKESTTIDENTYDFSNTNGHAVCIISGHVHHDASLTKLESDDGILTIATTGDLYRDGSGNVYSYTIDGTTYYRTPGTVREQAFDVVHIDLEEKKVYMTRIGGGADREFSFA